MIRTCHTCIEKTEILTYAKYDDGTGENLIYPWDKRKGGLKYEKENNRCNIISNAFNNNGNTGFCGNYLDSG